MREELRSLKDIGGRSLVFGESKAQELLVKVSSALVHITLVPQAQCWEALVMLHSSKDVAMKREIGKVLLLSSQQGSLTLSNVLKDVSSTYKGLHPHVLHSKGKMKHLWRAFCALVRNVLLPMAKTGVVHTDIRPGWKTTYNILQSYSNKRDEIKLVLVDFESLIAAEDAVGVIANGSAVNMASIAREQQTCFAFVWWQVLWMAYIWHAKSGDDSTCLFSSFFRVMVLGGIDANALRLGDCEWAAVHEMSRKEGTDAGDVENLLELLSDTFYL
jgi:hypothetical protein